MAWCVAFGCKNKKKTNKDKTFFALPSEPKVRERWIKSINRESLPKLVTLCSDHFEESEFDQSWDIQSQLFYKDRPRQRKLKTGAIPSIFPHKETPQERPTSSKRAKKKEQEENISSILSESDSSLKHQSLDSFIDFPSAIDIIASSSFIEEHPKKKNMSIAIQCFEEDIATRTPKPKIYKKSEYSQATVRMKEKASEAVIKTNEKSCQTSNESFIAEEFDDGDVSTDFGDLNSTIRTIASDCSEELYPVKEKTHIVFQSFEHIQNFLDMFGVTCEFGFEVEPQAKADVQSQSESEVEDHWLEKSKHKTEERDPEYIPESDENETETEDESEEEDNDNYFDLSEKKYVSDEDVFLVYSSKLQELFVWCLKCGSPIDKSSIQQRKNTGSNLSLQFTCINDCSYIWSSQPTLSYKKSSGNIELVAAAELSGIGYTKLAKLANMLRLKMFSKTMYYNHRGNYVYPEINNAWEKCQAQQVDEILTSGRRLELAADGQCDSPGHNATYNTVTFLDSKTEKVLDFKVVHVKEVTSSVAMEKEAFKRCLNNIENELNLDVRLVSTDRHSGIKKLMREEYPNILHQFDAWHVAKGLSKKIAKKAVKGKETEVLAKWAPSIVNHFYWSIQTCGGNGKELVERVTSILHHVVNKHRFPGNRYYKKCEHPRIRKDEANKKEWLVMGSVSHEILRKILNRKMLLKDLEHMAEQINTTMLEVFHAKKIRYLPKSIFFDMEKMIAGAQIAALDHNNSAQREQKFGLDEEGETKPLFSIAYSKPNKRFVAKTIKVDKDDEYIRYILRKIVRRVKNRKKANRKRRKLRQHYFKVAPNREESREDIIEKSMKYKRFKVD